MNTSISNIRLASQQLTDRRFERPADIVGWMGAMQAQDYNMAKWAVGIRSKYCNERLVEEALRQGEILRTHVMRPTWHFVTPENLRWMRPLSANRIMTSSKSRDRELGITEELYVRTNDIIGRAVEGGNHLTKDNLATVLESNGITTDSALMTHFLMRAEVEGIVCSGALQGKSQTYALFDERVPYAAPLPHGEALARLAHIYFSSHCPATVDDFAWWSGLLMKDVRTAVDAVKSGFCEEIISGKSYLISPEFAASGLGDTHVAHLLPAFDEYIISYKDRSDVLPSIDAGRVISSNGIFRPVMLYNGIATGLWKKTSSKSRIEMKGFTASDRLSSVFSDACGAYCRFLDD